MNKFVFLFLTMVLFRTSAFATPQITGGLFGTPSEFRKSVETAQAACADLSCPQASIQAHKLSHSEWMALAKDTRTTIHDQVKQRAEDWNDTILEGDYQAKGRAVIDVVYSLEKDQKVVGYRFVFSRQAWNTSTCPFDPAQPSIDGCQEGRIVDSAFLSIGLDEVFQDEQNFAHFVANSH